MKKIIEMFIAIFKIGAFTFGGGYAMIPLIEEEIVNNKKWMTKDEFMDILVISQSFPGALAINCSTFVGYKIAGPIGGIVAILAVVMPSFLIILTVAMFFMQFRDNVYVNKVFNGINAAVPVLVLIAVVSLAKGVKRNIPNILVMIIALILLTVINLNPVIVIILGAVYGILFLKKEGK